MLLTVLPVKMLKKFILGTCIVLLLVLLSLTTSSTTSSVSVSSEWGCGFYDSHIDDIDGWFVGNYFEELTGEWSAECDDPKTDFDTEDMAAIFSVNLSNVAAGDTVRLNVLYPNNNPFFSKRLTISQPGQTTLLYVYKIDPVNLPSGTYTINLTDKDGISILEKTFTITPYNYECEVNGYACCPPGMVCLQPALDASYSCASGTCCVGGCVAPVTTGLTLSMLPNCGLAGLQECDKIIALYDYKLHGLAGTKFVFETVYRDINVHCFNKTNVILGVHDDNLTGINQSYWKTYPSNITKLHGDYYRISAEIDYYGYIAVLKDSHCVSTDCLIPGFTTVPFDGKVMVSNPISMAVCQITRRCDATPNNICNHYCTQGLDPDCGICTSNVNDCCNPENDGVCDTDCDQFVDPDCGYAFTNRTVCYPSKDNCCNPAADKHCDINCPAGLDPDCNIRWRDENYNLRSPRCNKNNIREWGEECDGTDLGGKTCSDFGFTSGTLLCKKNRCRLSWLQCAYCNNNGVRDGKEECDGSDFGGDSTDCSVHMGYGYTGTVTCTNTCKVDTSGCSYTYYDYGGW
jgi:hypothetical protein